MGRSKNKFVRKLHFQDKTLSSTLVHSLALSSMVFGVVFTTSCGQKSTFRGASGTIPLEIPPPPVANKDSDATKKAAPGQILESYVYKLNIADGVPVIRNIVTPGTVTIHEGNGSPTTSTSTSTSTSTNDKSDKSALPADQAAQWKVSTKGPNIPEASSGVGFRTFDFTNASGYTQVMATFVRQTDQLTGFASQTLYIDAAPPTANMIVVGKNAQGFQVNINIVDNYGLDEKKSRVIACLPGVQTPFVLDPQTKKEDSLAPDCAVVAEGADLKEKGASFTISQVSLGDATYKPDDLKFFVSAVDLVGLRTTNGAIETSSVLSSMTLNLAKKPESIVSAGFNLEAQTLVSLIEGGRTIEVQKQPNLWTGYTLTTICGATETTTSYKDKITFDTTVEGAFSCSLLVKRPEGNLVSNKITIDYLVDKTAPQFGPLKITNIDGFLGPDSKVTIDFSVSDSSGISSQSLEYRPKGSQDWVPLTDVPNGDTSITVTWGQRPALDFEVRVIAKDRAQNLGMSTPQKWSKPFFNAAVLTTSVECFFCHMKIDGDVAGIDFPPDNLVHAASGENFLITGKIYGTGSVPARLSARSSGAVPNYRNEELKVFPTTKDAAGKTIFPMIDETKLEAKANGLLVNGAGKPERITRTYSGDLVVEGTAAQPFVVNGEVFVKGNLYIKGVYKGQGTIYARNIFVVNDIISADCIVAQGCPFPFTGTETEKLAQAQAAIAQKKASLYLGALEELLVGSRDHKLITIPGYLPLDQNAKDYLVSLGQRAYNLKDDAGVEITAPLHVKTPDTDSRVSVDVNRIDAYLYGSQHIVWRSYGNLLLNGGMMGYQAAIVASYPYNIYHKRNMPLVFTGDLINPRNGMSAKQNHVRYDYRLRAGGPGFETLKEFFAE